MENKAEKRCPSVKKKIGKMTYIAKVHFSENATETLSEKIKRMIQSEIEKK